MASSIAILNLKTSSLRRQATAVLQTWEWRVSGNYKTQLRHLVHLATWHHKLCVVRIIHSVLTILLWAL
jgi:type IV secretory pathway TrbL component